MRTYRPRWAAVVALLMLSACDTCRDDPPPAAVPGTPSQPEAVAQTLGTITGKEVFISIGGVKGAAHAGVLQALQSGYARAGFRVHWVEVPLSIEPLARKMVEVAAEYRGGDLALTQVVFHHTGHGWDDHFSYERADGTRGQTTHADLFLRLGSTFPEHEGPFQNTTFGAVFDACGQGGAADLRVTGRKGWVATSSPTAASSAACQANQCDYVCEACSDQLVPTYVFSTVFAQTLQGASDDAAFEAAHTAANAHLQSNWSCREDGRFVTYDD